MFKFVTFITILATVLSLQKVYADSTCAAQANFEGCKAIQNKVLSSCGPVDYDCQCKAQRLILQCYDLCPNYSSEATIQSSQVQGICAAVPSSASPSLPIASSTMSNVVAAASTSASSTNSNVATASSSSLSAIQSKSTANHVYPAVALVISCVAVGLLQF